MANKNPLVDSQKTKETRQVNIFLPLPSNGKTNGFRNNLSSGITNLNDSILKKFEILSRYSSKRIHRISVSNGPYIRKQGDYHSEILSMLKAQKIRIIILLTSLDKNSFQVAVREDVLNNNNISHLVEIEPNSENSEWGMSDFYLSSVKVKIKDGDYKVVLDLIEDIVLDISMFYAYCKENELINSIIFKRLLSKKKVEFAIKKNLSNPYGKLAKESLYYSFASTCRNKSGFKYLEYHQLWSEFIEFLNSSNDLILNNAKEFISELENEANKSDDENVSEVIKDELKKWYEFVQKIGIKKEELFITLNEELNVIDQFKLHKDYGEIGEIKIEKLIKNLSDGEYILARTTKRPKETKFRIAVLNTLGVGNKVWRKGYLKVFPFSEYESLIRYTPHISLFKFNIKNGKN